jgi:hypothetical protein
MVQFKLGTRLAAFILAFGSIGLAVPALAGEQPRPVNPGQGGSGLVTPPAGGTVTTLSPSFQNSSEAVSAPASTQLINVPVFAGGQGNRAGSSLDECYMHVTTATVGGGYAGSDIAGGLSSFSIGGQLTVPLNGRMGKICGDRARVHLERDQNRLQYERNADALARFKACNQAYLARGLNSQKLCAGFVPFGVSTRPMPTPQRVVPPAPAPRPDRPGTPSPSDF